MDILSYSLSVYLLRTINAKLNFKFPAVLIFVVKGVKNVVN